MCVCVCVCVCVCLFSSVYIGSIINILCVLVIRPNPLFPPQLFPSSADFAFFFQVCATHRIPDIPNFQATLMIFKIKYYSDIY